jgi:hypothetical protein
MIALAGVAVAVSATEAAAARLQRCMVKVVKASPAIENPASVLKAGQLYGPITQVRIVKKDGAVSYCAHGDYCVPAAALELVSPCLIHAGLEDGEDEWTYSPE